MVPDYGGGQVLWFAHPANVLTGVWQANMVVGEIGGAYELARRDLDNDGAADLVVGRSDDTGGLYELVYLENAGGGSYTRYAYPYGRAAAVEAGDMDGDNDLDVASATYGDNRVDWWQNVHTSGGPTPTEGPPVSALAGRPGGLVLAALSILLFVPLATAARGSRMAPRTSK